MSEEYNGHPSWEHWNVALWISNDESIYAFARSCVRRTIDYRRAAEMFIANMSEFGYKETPDGAPYTQEYVEHGLKCTFEEDEE